MVDEKRLTIELDAETKKHFSEKAKAEGHTMRWLIIQWIKKFLES